MPDPEAVKPSDWDDRKEVEDEAAAKPSGWLDDEPLLIDDPSESSDTWARGQGGGEGLRLKGVFILQQWGLRTAEVAVKSPRWEQAAGFHVG